ncbi:probable glutamate receptor [Palaemon carinicauda]|uniref:probable glutamate receptor n=1 Tax=Palaemon carinicauda TaxID=392227 RepID=UPI0035B60356
MKLLWTSPRCQGVFLFLSSPEFLFKFSNEDFALWDYTARVIIVGLTEKDLQVFSQTRKAKKTEQIIGIVNGEAEGHLKIYRNELYWGRRGVVKIADWRGDSFLRRPTFFPNKVSNLRQVVLNVSTFEYPPATIYRRSSDGSLLFKYGRDISLVETLAEVFNFSVSFKEPGPGELWGRIHPNGSWDGIVGFLARGEADIAVANIYITALLGRSEFQEYSSPYTSDVGCVVSRKDQPLPQWLSPVLPFHPVTWAAFFIGLLISGPLLSLFGKASAHFGTENPNFQSLAVSCLYAYGVHFNHSMATLPKRKGTQIFVSFLWLYAIIFIIAYCSNLVAFLTVSRDPASIETFQKLQESKLRVLGIGSFFKTSMEKAGNMYLRALAERFYPYPTFEDAKKEILSGGAVMLDSRSVLEFHSAQIRTYRGRPLLRILKECFSPYNIGIAYQRNSPLKPQFDRAITALFESGLVRRWFLDSIELFRKFQIEDAETNRLSFQGDSDQGRESGVIPLGMEHMLGIFIIYGFGVLFSAMLFVLERTFHRSL